MQIQPDYSHQLEEIAKALNRPSIPQWEVALIAALVGAFLGIVGQWLMKMFDSWWDIHKMRRVLYLDLLKMFQGVEFVMAYRGLGGPELFDWREQELKALLTFDGEAYLKAHQDVYMQLSERGAAERVYGAYHWILDEKRWLIVNSRIANGLLADLVERNQLQSKYIKMFLGAEAEPLLTKLHAIYEERLRKPPSGTTEPTN